MRLQDECSLSAVGNHEAVDNVMELAAIATALVDVAHKLFCLAAVWRILKEERGQRESTEYFVLTTLLFFYYY